MGRLVLRIERGGEVLGSWHLDGQPLEMSLHDEQTGDEIGRFVASAPAGSHDEVQAAPSVPPAPPARSPEDDLTMPLPEQMVAGAPKDKQAALDEGPTLILRRPRNLAEALELAGLEDENSVELELLEDEKSVELELLEDEKSVELELLEDEKSVELELDETVETDEDEDEKSMELPAPIGVMRRVPRFRGRSAVAAAPVPAPSPKAVPAAPAAPPSTERRDRLALTETVSEARREDLSDAPSLTEEAPRTSQPRPIWTLGVRPAEVWVLRNNDWISGGRLQPGQRARSRGGWVRLEQNGSLALASGPDLSGTATLPDGRTVPVPLNSQELSFSPGTSVLLRAEQHGIYVRSEAPAAQ